MNRIPARRRAAALPGAALLCALAVASPAVAPAQDAERSTTALWAETLRYGTDPEVLEALGRIQTAGERSLDDDLVRILSASRNDEVRSRILAYLTDTGNPAGTDAALDLLGQREDLATPLLRAVVAYLGKLKERRAVDDLEQIARGADAALAGSAVTALGAIGGGDRARFLVELLTGEGVDVAAAVRNQIILALGEIGDTIALEPLMEIARDRDAERVSRMYALSSLGKLGDRRALPVLTAALSEQDALLRTYAAGALGRLRAPGTAAALLQVLRDASWQVRLEAARAVADGAAGAEAGPELLGMLQYRARRDEVAQVRRESIRALGTLGGKESFDLLRELYTDDKQPLDIRGAALTELVRGDLAASLEAVGRVVEQEWQAKSDRQKTLEATADQLSRVESKELEQLYRRFLQSANLAVKIGAIRGIARNGITGFAEELTTAARSEPLGLRREALAALEKLGLPRP